MFIISEKLEIPDLPYSHQRFRQKYGNAPRDRYDGQILRFEGNEDRRQKSDRCRRYVSARGVERRGERHRGKDGIRNVIQKGIDKGTFDLFSDRRKGDGADQIG